MEAPNQWVTIDLGLFEQQKPRAMSAFLSPHLISSTAQRGLEDELGDLALGERSEEPKGCQGQRET